MSTYFRTRPSLKGEDPNAAPASKTSKIKLASIESQRDALIEKFGIEVVGEGKVRLALNGASRIEFLNQVQEIASELHGRPAIYADRLSKWANDNTFTAKPKKDLEIAVDGNVKGSTKMTRTEQEEKGWNNVDLCDLAVAHAAYFLATGKDLFGANVVRARGGGLYFLADGLSVGPYGGDFPRNYVAASAALPPQECAA